jgi:outer membrane biogenesis lipoprotein LolB
MKAYRALIPALALLAACSGPASKTNAQEPELAQPTRSPPSSVEGMKSSFSPVV